MPRHPGPAWRPLAAAALLAWLAACQNASLPDVNPFATAPTGTPGRFIDKAARLPPPPPRPQSGETLQTRRDLASARTVADSVRLKRIHGAGITALPGVERYLNSILRRLAAGWPGPAVQARIYVVPGNELYAEALPGGGIFVTVGFLDVLESEDEVAFLLAHELSHVLLAHYQRGELQQLAQQASAVITVGLDAASELQQRETGRSPEGLQRAAVVNYLVSEASEVVLMPAWSRQHEEEADMLGLDLLLAARFNDYGATRVLEILEQDEARDKGPIGIDPELQRTVEAQLGSGEWQDSLATALSQIKQDFSRLLATLQAGHASAGARLKTLNGYLEREYPDRAFGTLSTAPWLAVWSAPAVQREVRALLKADTVMPFVAARRLQEAAAAGTEALNLAPGSAFVRLQMSYLRDAQGRRQDALTNLQRGMADPGRPLRLYTTLALAQLNARQVGEAESILASAESEFGGAPVLLAPRIRVERAKGNWERMNALLLRCRVEAAADIVEQCQAAAGEAPAGSGFRSLFR